MSFGGAYSEERSGIPPMSDETIRQALAAHAAGTGRPLQQELSQSIYNSNGPPPSGARQSPPRSSASRQNSFQQPQPGSRQNSFQQPQQGSRQNSFAQQQQAPRQNSFPQHTPPLETYIDADGNQVQTFSGAGELPLRVYNPDPSWTGLDAVSKPNSGAIAANSNPNITAYTNENGDRVWESTGPVPMRCHTPPAADGCTSPPVYSTRDKEGNYVQHYAGESGDLAVRAHYNWDNPQQNHY